MHQELVKSSKFGTSINETCLVLDRYEVNCTAQESLFMSRYAPRFFCHWVHLLL